MNATLLIFLGLFLGADSPSGNDLVPFQKADKWGFKDATGKIVVEPEYDQVGEFSCGLAAVNRGAMRDSLSMLPTMTGGAWGYVDTRGKLVIPVVFEYAIAFSDGLARVHDNQGTHYLDPTGKAVIDLGPNDGAGDFQEGLAPVREDRSRAGKDWLTKFIDKKGRTVFTVDGYAKEFSDGMAVLVVEQKEIDHKVTDSDSIDGPECLYGYVDRTGKVVIPARFAEALAFHEGLAAVRPKKTTVYGMGDAWGYIDKSGKYVLKPNYNEAGPFQNGVARVHVGGTLQTPFDGVPGWEGGEWQLIDKTGKVLKRSKEWIE